ncbi:uncharacterized protein LOC143264072 isoform X2 [Megachile rotundata]|uniref:uncharacterized protein LOC143264072 isoform X2 n=1 Tax=Megachile rotundata TaxID=143995 RepID=UPI003FD20083
MRHISVDNSSNVRMCSPMERRRRLISSTKVSAWLKRHSRRRASSSSCADKKPPRREEEDRQLWIYRRRYAVTLTRRVKDDHRSSSSLGSIRVTERCSIMDRCSGQASGRQICGVVRSPHMPPLHLWEKTMDLRDSVGHKRLPSRSMSLEPRENDSRICPRIQPNRAGLKTVPNGGDESR